MESSSCRPYRQGATSSACPPRGINPLRNPSRLAPSKRCPLRSSRWLRPRPLPAPIPQRSLSSAWQSRQVFYSSACAGVVAEKRESRDPGICDPPSYECERQRVPRLARVLRRSSRNDFAARAVATVSTTFGRPRTWLRRKASVRRRSCFQHSRSHVPTARCTQNSSSYKSFSRSWNGLSSSPARTNRWSAYVDARRRQMLFARVHRRTSRNRETFAYTIPAVGPEARPSSSPHPVAVSTQRSASFHEPSSRTFSYRPRRRIANDFSSYIGPDQSASARAFTSAAPKVG